MANESCSKCRFWCGEADTLDGEGRGECRRYAPRPEFEYVEGSGMSYTTHWPGTLPDDWCGEFVSNGKGSR